MTDPQTAYIRRDQLRAADHDAIKRIEAAHIRAQQWLKWIGGFAFVVMMSAAATAWEMGSRVTALETRLVEVRRQIDERLAVLANTDRRREVEVNTIEARLQSLEASTKRTETLVEEALRILRKRD